MLTPAICHSTANESLKSLCRRICSFLGCVTSQLGFLGLGGPAAHFRGGLDAQRFPGSDILCALPKNGQGIV